MRHLFALVFFLLPGLVAAQVDCELAETRFVEVLGRDKDDLFRADVARAVADPSSRWVLAVSALLGVALQVESGSATAENAALLIAADPLLDCWRFPTESATDEQIAQMERIDTLLPQDRRSTLVKLAQGLQ